MTVGVFPPPDFAGTFTAGSQGWPAEELLDAEIWKNEKVFRRREMKQD